MSEIFIVNPVQLLFKRKSTDAILPLADLIVSGSETANINGRYVVGTAGSSTYSGPNSYTIVSTAGIWKLLDGSSVSLFKTTGASVLGPWVVDSTNPNPLAVVPHVAFENIKFREAWVSGLKSLAGAQNTGDVYIGLAGVANQQPLIIGAGEEIRLKAPYDTGWELYKWFLKIATDGDGVVVILS